MSRNAFDAIERQLNEAEDYRATVKQERALDLAEKRIAELEGKLNQQYTWKTVADYEAEVGFKVNDAFQMGWAMARTTDDFLRRLSGEEEQK